MLLLIFSELNKFKKAVPYFSTGGIRKKFLRELSKNFNDQIFKLQLELATIK